MLSVLSGLICDVDDVFFLKLNFHLCVSLQQPSQCWENRFGREMYKLCIFNFLAAFCNAFLLSYPRKWVCLRSTVSFSLSHRCGLEWKDQCIWCLTSVDSTTVRLIYGERLNLLLRTQDSGTFCVNYLSSVRQAAAGEVPLILAGPVVGETALPDPFQCLGSGVQSDSVLGGSLLLPSAASDRNCHTDGHVLHQQGCLEHLLHTFTHELLNQLSLSLFMSLNV